MKQDKTVLLIKFSFQMLDCNHQIWRYCKFLYRFFEGPFEPKVINIINRFREAHSSKKIASGTLKDSNVKVKVLKNITSFIIFTFLSIFLTISLTGLIERSDPKQRNKSQFSVSFFDASSYSFGRSSPNNTIFGLMMPLQLNSKQFIGEKSSFCSSWTICFRNVSIQLSFSHIEHRQVLNLPWTSITLSCLIPISFSMPSTFFVYTLDKTPRCSRTATKKWPTDGWHRVDKTFSKHS